MRRLALRSSATSCAASLILMSAFSTASATELVQLSESNWDDFVPQGKEVDCIYGDWVLRNDHLVAVIAEALPTRNANMTVRKVGGSVIDLTVRDNQSDQLSAYYPLGARYDLTGPGLAVGEGSVEVTFRGPAEDGHSSAEVTYSLANDARWLKITTRITNSGDKPLDVDLSDAIRADGEFKFGSVDDLGMFWAYDSYWGQAYGALPADPAWQITAPETTRYRSALQIAPKDESAAPKRLAPGETRELVRYLIPAANTIELAAVARELRGETLSQVSFDVRDPAGPLAGAEVVLETSDGKPLSQGRTDQQGQLTARLPEGRYNATVSALGRGEKTVDVAAPAEGRQQVELPAAGYVVAAITGADGQPIPCKVQFSGQGDTPQPHFGPDSAVHGVRNLYYSENGRFRTALAPGTYEVIISHGPEFDAVFTMLDVRPGEEAKLAAVLERTVDTSGWLSADFHSHSTPSGDNTASQRGRVLNLLAEHVEFAPCTEHNRLTVYDEHLKHFDAVKQMLTCPGIELTGRPGSVNHQNAFPMQPRPRTQDGGAPVHDEDPVAQIERLAMWHDGSDKLVQINHPSIPQMIGDRDLDGSPDGGFEKMFSFMDVIEVHPLDRIFYTPETLPKLKDQGYAVFHWLQLANLGYRTPGVVNTDAHWNFHGSGGLRNYIKSSTDVAIEASVPTLVHTCEHGNIMMTNGPFMEVTAAAAGSDESVTVGDDLKAPGGKLRLKVRVQCPNWLEVNRVQVFVNGKPEAKWNYTQRSHPGLFTRDTVVFDQELPVELEADAHLVVACAGEGKTLGKVMGPEGEKNMPVAVGNPIFVDVDGDGFEPNGDMLGVPLAVEPGHKPSKPHRHHHEH